MVNTFFIIPMTVTTEQGGRTNMFAKEPRMYVDTTYVERYGLVFGLFSYAVTGNFFFGLA